MLIGLYPDLGGIDCLRASEVSPSHETRWGWSGIPPLQEHRRQLFVHEHLQPRGRECIASSLPALALPVLVIILPREGDMAGEKSCLGSIPGV